MRQILPFEFHISRQAREHYAFDETLFSTDGEVILANLSASRILAQKINTKRDLDRYPERAVSAGEINALGLIAEILHQVLNQFIRENQQHTIAQALSWLDERLERKKIDGLLLQFLEEFPPSLVYTKQQSVSEYLITTSQNYTGELVSNREIALEELLMLWLTNSNPAAAPFAELFSDGNLRRGNIYGQAIDELVSFFRFQAAFGPEKQSLIDLLRSPALVVPGSLIGQLKYINYRWGFLPREYNLKILVGLDIVKEETRPVFSEGGGGPVFVPTYLPPYPSDPAQINNPDEPYAPDHPYNPDYPEAERFSPDLHWMPNLILIAKNAYVWLDQLSKKYSRKISRLDEIPDIELEQMQNSGVTGLWLIGIWERSTASRVIKQMRGNPEAVASAYSIFNYDIASDLGGEEAFDRFRLQTTRVGIRLASDMVPNHMGIDSRWVIEHPDWFISLDGSPFPAYTFNGPNLSWDPRVGIFIEDHYFNNTDAAVVFKRIDYWTGTEKFIYHGNDGTSMPWNDTAQLNYLIPEVREAVIQTILSVARKFPVIRFDAAMTLAKRHYHRLWFPEPGSGGDIPSRAGLGLTKEKFDEVFPEEFWREVVDRVANEVPDTLLLAEAFWLMEGYFVRTLGMHRVYNSAFMNMLRDERNQEYRLVIKNTLEFDPEILKRYVNFMNNPDERTAVDQFGKGDKYFGICTLLATLPGLPMLGHGQIEGFTEKYGMEYRKAYWEEQVDPYLLERHEKEIFPLFRIRRIFAEVNDFLLYDFRKEDGTVDENVYAFSNLYADQKALVIFNNQTQETSGRIFLSVAYAEKAGEDKKLVQRALGEGLSIPDDPNTWLILHDQKSNLDFLRNCSEIIHSGFYLDLGAYQSHVFLNFQVIEDDLKFSYQYLAVHLQGGGVPDITEALQEFQLAPVLKPFNELINHGFLDWIIMNRWNERGIPGKNLTAAIDEATSTINRLGIGITSWLLKTHQIEIDGQETKLAVNAVRQELADLLALPAFYEKYPLPRSKQYEKAVKYLLYGTGNQYDLPHGNQKVWSIILSLIYSRFVKQLVAYGQAESIEIDVMQDWLLEKQITRAFKQQGMDDWASLRGVTLVSLLLKTPDWVNLPTNLTPGVILDFIQHEELAQRFINVNEYNNIKWFNKENFEELTWWLYILQAINITRHEDKINPARSLVQIFSVIESVLEIGARSGYQFSKLVQL